MSAEKIVIELYLAIERATGSGNIHKVRLAARSLGYKFTNKDSSDWLKPFIAAAAARSSAPLAAPEVGTDIQVPQHEGGYEENQVPQGCESAPDRHLNGTANGLTRDKVIPSLLAEPSALPAKKSQASTQGNPPPSHRPLKLPLDAQVQDARRAILAAVWDLIGRTPFSRTITKTEWGRRNSRVALDLATNGVTADQCIAAYRAAEKRMGTPPRTLQIVQDQLGRMALPQPVKPTDKPSGAQTTMYSRCRRCDSFKRELDMVPSVHDRQKLVCRECSQQEHAA